eukprot:scaffold1146_cov399-Prasinococcus_capsulatus_cf.AAC.8
MARAPNLCLPLMEKWSNHKAIRALLSPAVKKSRSSVESLAMSAPTCEAYCSQRVARSALATFSPLSSEAWLLDGQEELALCGGRQRDKQRAQVAQEPFARLGVVAAPVRAHELAQSALHCLQQLESSTGGGGRRRCSFRRGHGRGPRVAASLVAAAQEQVHHRGRTALFFLHVVLPVRRQPCGGQQARLPPPRLSSLAGCTRSPAAVVCACELLCSSEPAPPPPSRGSASSSREALPSAGSASGAPGSAG